MFEGTVISINISPRAEAPMESVVEVRAIPGKGLEGDRYFFKQGTFYKPQPDRELTLVEAEAIESFRDDFKIDFDLSTTRRNIVTRPLEPPWRTNLDGLLMLGGRAAVLSPPK